jgi:hypothetical protein
MSGKFYASTRPEWFDIGPADTREDAVSELLCEYDGDVIVGDTIYTGIGMPITVGELARAVDGETIVERMHEQLFDEGIEDLLDYLAPSREQVDALTRRLQAATVAWLKELLEGDRLRCVTIVSTEEIKVTQEMLDNA